MSCSISRCVLALGVIGLMAVVVVMSACGPREETIAREEASEVAEPARHAVYSAELQDLMRRMNGDIGKVWPQEVAAEKEELTKQEQEARFRRAEQLAEALKKSAKSIPESAESMDLNEAEHQSFDALVRQLQFHSAELASAAKAKNRQSMQLILGRIENTCNYCHTQFDIKLKPIEID